jgi:hypothetical protein
MATLLPLKSGTGKAISIVGFRKALGTQMTNESGIACYKIQIGRPASGLLY